MTQPLTMEQAVIVSAYTGKLICPFPVMHEAVEAKLGRPVWTHQFGDQEVADEIAAAFKDDFISLLPVGVAGRDEPESKP